MCIDSNVTCKIHEQVEDYSRRLSHSVLTLTLRRPAEAFSHVVFLPLYKKKLKLNVAHFFIIQIYRDSANTDRLLDQKTVSLNVDTSNAG